MNLKINVSNRIVFALTYLVCYPRQKAEISAIVSQLSKIFRLYQPPVFLNGVQR